VSVAPHFKQYLAMSLLSAWQLMQIFAKSHASVLTEHKYYLAVLFTPESLNVSNQRIL
jgi:hypothetical protein